MKIKAITLISLLCLLASILTACGKESVEERISKALYLEFAKGTKAEYEDTHGGFHGDGYLYATLKLAGENYEDLVNQVQILNWNVLPMDTDIELVIYGGEYGGDENGGVYSESWIVQQTGLPKVKEGYWIFLDRQDASYSRGQDSDYLNRFSWNFTFAVLDTKNRVLHYLEYDT